MSEQLEYRHPWRFIPFKVVTLLGTPKAWHISHFPLSFHLGSAAQLTKIPWATRTVGTAILNSGVPVSLKLYMTARCGLVRYPRAGSPNGVSLLYLQISFFLFLPTSNDDKARNKEPREQTVARLLSLQGIYSHHTHV